jgi:hypothetical protein
MKALLLDEETVGAPLFFRNLSPVTRHSPFTVHLLMSLVLFYAGCTALVHLLCPLPLHCRKPSLE